MSRGLITVLCLLFCKFSPAQKGMQYLKAMHLKNSGHWYSTMTFVQTTEFYRNDSMVRKATWYEALKLPYDLRIDLDDPAKGNFVLYKKDSVYRFQNKNLRNVSADTNPFIFFIGGMYYQPFDSALQYLSAKGYDVKKGYQSTWKNRPVYVIGRENEADSSNAIWIDKKNLWIMRLVEKDKGRTIDAHMDGHKKLKKGSTETRVEIYVNGKLAQVEKYDQISIDVSLEDMLFDPLNASSAKHWFNESKSK
jgi:hypothetical protein